MITEEQEIITNDLKASQLRLKAAEIDLETAERNSEISKGYLYALQERNARAASLASLAGVQPHHH